MDHDNKPENQVHNPESHEEQEQYGPPHGAVTFAALMLISYIAYYLFIWFEVFVIRGA